MLRDDVVAGPWTITRLAILHSFAFHISGSESSEVCFGTRMSKTKKKRFSVLPLVVSTENAIEMKSTDMLPWHWRHPLGVFWKFKNETV